MAFDRKEESAAGRGGAGKGPPIAPPAGRGGTGRDGTARVGAIRNAWGRAGPTRDVEDGPRGDDGKGK